MKSLWCNSFWLGILLFISGNGVLGQVPFNIAISDTFFNSFGFDILFDDSALVVSSAVDPDFINETFQRISKHELDGTIEWQTIITNNILSSFGSVHDNNLIRTNSGYMIMVTPKILPITLIQH